MTSPFPYSQQLLFPLQEEQVSCLPVVNVASIPQRSPFRYPGGKTWLVPYIRRWLCNLPKRPTVFVEPFTGGGIIGLTVGFEELADQVILVELDHCVASVWQTILGEDAEWLARRIELFELTATSVNEVLSAIPSTIGEQAFQTILRNRVNRGGILASGAGRIKEGEGGKGLKSRWYPETLARRIRHIHFQRNKFTFIEGNGLEVLKSFSQKDNTVFFIDPPYTASGKKAGSRLYTHFEIDHLELFNIASTVQGDFLMTYDNAEEVHQFAISHDLDTRMVPMKNTHHKRMYELLIGKDLKWLG
jgi:DNA adenine methylase